MSLPTSRNTTYAAGSPILSADLNDLQDQIVNLETKRIATYTRHIPAVGGATFDGTNWTRVVASGWVTATVLSPGDVFIQIPTLESDIITAVRGYIQQGTATAGAMSMRLVQVNLSTGATSLGSFDTSSALTSLEVLDIPSLPLTVGDHVALFAHFAASASAITRKIFGIEVDYHRA